MRRGGKRRPEPEEEEEEEMEFDMDELEGDLGGMSLEDLLSPEEIEVLNNLVEAAANADLEAVKTVLNGAIALGMKKEILVNAPAPDMRGNNVLMIAFEEGNVELAKYLLDNGGDVTPVNEEGDNCFALACDGGHVALVELLMEKGLVKLFGPIDEEGNGALHIAAQGHIDTLKLLLDKGAFVNVPSAETKATALHLAVSAGKIENVKLLLEKGADSTKLTAAGLTPLMVCAEGLDPKDAIEIATLLLASKSDVNKAAPNGATAYDIAEASGAYGFARFLLEKGAVPKGLPANTIGVDTYNVSIYYQTGEKLPGARTRAASIVLGSKLYVGGGLRCLSSDELEALVENAAADGDEIDETTLVPFAPMADVFVTDLAEIALKPLVADLSTLKATFGSTINLSKTHKGPHLLVADDHTVTAKYEEDACCDHDHGHEGHEHEEPVFNTSILGEDSYTADKTPIAYYEVTVTASNYKNIAASIGWTAQASEWEFEQHPGWALDSVGYHSDDGRVRVPLDEESEGPAFVGNTWGVGDTVGAGYIFATKEVFFTLNGRFLGVTLSSSDFEAEELRPVVGISTDTIVLKANFGTAPFRFNFHVPTVHWTKLNDLPENYLAMLPLPGSTEEILVIPDSTKAVFHYNPVTQHVTVKETKASKIASIPMHAEHSVHILGNKVILFARLEALLIPGKRKSGLLLVLDLATHTWTDVLAPVTMPQKKLAKTLQDTNAQLSGTVIGPNYYIFSPDKAYQLNLANLTLVATKINGLLPNEDMGFYPISDTRTLAFTIAPNMETYRFNLLDMPAKQWYLPRFGGLFLEPIVGKAIVQHNSKLFSYGGFSSSDTIAKSYFMSMTPASNVPTGLSTAFNNQALYSDVSVKVGEQTVHLHKAILAARSKHFASVLAAGGAIEVPATLHANSVLAVLKYLYTDSIDISLVTAKDYKTMLEAVKALAPQHEDRIIEELLFTRTLTNSVLSAELAELLKSGNFADLSLEAQGATIKAHRVVLASRSAGFATLIGANSSVQLAHPAVAVENLTAAIYLTCSYNLNAAPRSSWDAILALGAELKVCCLDKCITANKLITVGDIPLAVQ